MRVKGLFEGLPVRRGVFEKQLKAQRGKLFRVIQAYAITCVGVRFSVVDVDKKGKASTKLNTGKSRSRREAVEGVMGKKFVDGLVEFTIDLGDAVTGGSITGLISSAPTGEGRNSGSREMT